MFFLPPSLQLFPCAWMSCKISVSQTKNTFFSSEFLFFDGPVGGFCKFSTNKIIFAYWGWTFKPQSTLHSWHLENLNSNLRCVRFQGLTQYTEILDYQNYLYVAKFVQTRNVFKYAYMHNENIFWRYKNAQSSCFLTAGRHTCSQLLSASRQQIPVGSKISSGASGTPRFCPELWAGSDSSGGCHAGRRRKCGPGSSEAALVSHQGEI